MQSSAVAARWTFLRELCTKTVGLLKLLLRLELEPSPLIAQVQGVPELQYDGAIS